MINGHVERGYERVREVFEENFRKRNEIGAACAAFVGGQKVVDLWGGHRDDKKTKAWNENTKVIVFSVSKGISSVCLMVANSRGLLDWDEKVCAYWPEFAAAGKDSVTVRQLMSHQAGLCCLDEKITTGDLANPDALAVKLAGQKPLWQPGTRHAYHALSLGWYESELLRRVDPEHRTLGCFFHEEVAVPLRLDFYIGLPKSIDQEEISSIHFPKNMIKALVTQDMQSRKFFFSMMKKGSITQRAFTNPNIMDLNNRDFLALENPAFGGVGTARSIARVYDCCARGGAELGIKKETFDAVCAEGVPPSEGDYDELLKMNSCFSLGFLKPSRNLSFGSDSRAFGAPGAGGAFGFADPSRGISFAYVTNRMGLSLFDDPREKKLRDAVYAATR